MVFFRNISSLDPTLAPIYLTFFFLNNFSWLLAAPTMLRRLPSPPALPSRPYFGAILLILILVFYSELNTEKVELLTETPIAPCAPPLLAYWRCE
jgi:hypothetical protein